MFKHFSRSQNMTAASSSSSSPTTFADVHPDIIRENILSRLDGRSLYALSSTSLPLNSLCTEEKLWSDICKSTWPSSIDPRVDDVISTFPSGHLSFFEDSSPALFHHNHRKLSHCWPTWQPKYLKNHQQRTPHPTPSELISAVDIHYQNDLVYSRVEFTDTTNAHFLSPPLWIEFNDWPLHRRLNRTRTKPGISRVIDLKVDELLGPDDAIISHLKESVTLNWILIDPTRKRAGNLSSVKPVLVRKHWMTNDINLRYVTVLPGCDPNEVVQCKIEVTCEVGKEGVGLHVREVILQIQDLESRCLTGREFLVITQGAILEENGVRRKMVGDGERERGYKEFLDLRKEKREMIKIKEKRMELVSKVIQIGILMSFLMWVCFGILN